MKNSILTAGTSLALAGALAISATAPSFARNGRIAAGVIGFAAGTALGAAAAGASRPYYGDGYYGGYAYDPGYVEDGYASEAWPPAYVYSPRHYYGSSSCTVRDASRELYSYC
jgi:hypothetical protein